jgi:hypothetical protein
MSATAAAFAESGHGGLAGPPATLGNMRANGVRSLAVSCWQCHHQAVLSGDSWPDDMPVPAFGPRMVCSRCGIIGADARPNWREQPARLSGAGHRAMAMSTERRRALRLLAGSPLGCTEAMSAPGERRHPSAGEVGGL